MLLPVTQEPLRVTDPGSSSCTVGRRLQPPSEGFFQQTRGRATGGHAAGTDSSSSRWTRLILPAGLDKALLRCCRSGLLSSTAPKGEDKVSYVHKNKTVYVKLPSPESLSVCPLQMFFTLRTVKNIRSQIAVSLSEKEQCGFVGEIPGKY